MSMKHLFAMTFLVALFGGLAYAGSEAPAPPQTPDKVDMGKAIDGANTFRRYCASCHGSEARGDGPLAKDLRAQPANLTELSKRHGGEFPYDLVIETVSQGRSVSGHGTEDMPAWGDAFKMTEKTEEAARKMMDELAHFLWSKQAE